MPAHEAGRLVRALHRRGADRPPGRSELAARRRRDVPAEPRQRAAARAQAPFATVLPGLPRPDGVAAGRSLRRVAGPEPASVAPAARGRQRAAFR